MSTNPGQLSPQAKTNMPTHVAIIMDGNGRWAKERSLPRIEGHRNGVESVRAVVRAASADRIEHLDSWLWSYRDDSFLPHGIEGEGNTALQPILLTTQSDNANHAQALFLIDGVEPGPLDGYSRCLVLFDGKEGEQLALARRQWKALKDGGAVLSYWKQRTEGGWEKQA